MQLIKEAPKPELIDGHGLQHLYGDKYRQRLEYGAYGCKSLRELLDKCEKLKPRMKNDKMYVRCTCCDNGVHGTQQPALTHAAAADPSTPSVREAKRAAKRARDGPDAAMTPASKKAKAAKKIKVERDA